MLLADLQWSLPRQCNHAMMINTLAARLARYVGTDVMIVLFRAQSLQYGNIVVCMFLQFLPTRVLLLEFRLCDDPRPAPRQVGRILAASMVRQIILYDAQN